MKINFDNILQNYPVASINIIIITNLIKKLFIEYENKNVRYKNLVLFLHLSLNQLLSCQFQLFQIQLFKLSNYSIISIIKTKNSLKNETIALDPVIKTRYDEP